jgi:hypothetical protein
VLLSGALALIGLAAPAASVMAASPAARVSYSSSGPALAKPWRTPRPARAVSASGS